MHKREAQSLYDTQTIYGPCQEEILIFFFQLLKNFLLNFSNLPPDLS